MRAPFASPALGSPPHDHYYWLTAFLASRGAQTTICRAIAASVFALGAVPMLLVPDLRPAARLLAVAVTVCCLAMAGLWSRHCWPSRRQSQSCVVVGTVCIGVICLLPPDPAVGLVGCTVFALLAGYGALFHSLRLLAFTWLVAAGTLAVLAWRLADADVAVVASAVVATTVLNLFVAFASRLVIRLADIREYHEDIEPLTGLLTGEAFIAHAATLIGARNRGDDQHLVIVDVRIDELARRAEGAAGVNRARIALAGQLRDTLRRDAVIAHVGDREFLIADVFTAPDPTPLLDRIRGTVAAPPARRTASIGVASSPLSPLAQHPSPEVLEELLGVARLAAADVEAHGGNDIRVTANPALSVLGSDDASGDH